MLSILLITETKFTGYAILQTLQVLLGVLQGRRNFHNIGTLKNMKSST